LKHSFQILLSADGDNGFLRNVGKQLKDYTIPKAKRRYSKA